VESPTSGAGVARGTLRHNLVIVILARIVPVQLCMATHTVNLVPGAFVFYDFKDRQMTLAAFCRRERLYVLLIKSRLIRGLC
jgi:hypothetical protein